MSLVNLLVFNTVYMIMVNEIFLVCDCDGEAFIDACVIGRIDPSNTYIYG